MEDLAVARLFVYGTLRRGFSSHGLLRRLRARFLGTGHIRGKLYELGEYPGAVESSGGGNRICGEVYLLPHAARAFKALDNFEEFDPANPGFALFVRKEATVVLAGGGEIRAWVYWLNRVRAAGRPVPSGDYSKRRA